MARVCEISGKRTTTGNNRSHSMRATKRTFKPNIQKKRIFDPATGQWRTMKVAASALRTLVRQQREASRMIQSEKVA